MAKFKCIHTGNEFTFNDVDSVEMRKHVEYEEVVEEVISVVSKPKTNAKKEST
jgi:hypothetical protein